MSSQEVFLSIFLLLSLMTSNGQTKEDLFQEAQSRNISTRQEAINELARNGISVNEARRLAAIRGMDFDAYLQEYLNANAPTSVGPNQADGASTVTALSIEEPSEVIIPVAPPTDVPKSNPKYFGYSIFENNPFGQKEYLVGNIDEGYLLAPGDELRISVFGDNSMELVAKIDLNGNIYFPNLGVFQAGGFSYASIKKRLTVFLGKFYSGLLATPARSFLDVSLTQIRPVKITVLGQVNTPGPHLVNGLATVINALYASGGIKTSGTLREVKVYRGNQLLKVFDLYDFITEGAIDQDIRLANNDIIFVGPRLSEVTLNGQVRQTGIYELLPTESLEDLIGFSGGLQPDASLQNINVSRIAPAEIRTLEQPFNRTLLTFDWNKDAPFALYNGDVITFPAILNRELNRVTLGGNVNQPGTYSLNQYPNLLDLIEKGGLGILPKTYLEKVDIFREDESGQLSFLTLNLNDVLTGTTNIQLQDKDRIQIYSLRDVEGVEEVTIGGFVENPKKMFWRADPSLYDVLFASTPLDELEFQSKVLADRIDLKRFDASTGLYDLYSFKLSNLRVLKTTYLEPKDEVLLFSKAVVEDITPTIQVRGSVKNPGEYALGKDWVVEDALLMAGGFSDFADQSIIELYHKSENTAKGEYALMEEYAIDLEYLTGLRKEPVQPLYLKNYDYILVKEPKDAELIPSVSIEGEVVYPGSYPLEREQTTVQSMIKRAGGLTAFAHLKASYLIRNGLPLSASLASNLENVFFQKGDRLVIISDLAPVVTNGNVLNPSSFKFEPGIRAKHYLKNSGGVKKKTMDKFITYPSGQTRKIGFLKNPKVVPGSQILATAKPPKSDREGQFMEDFTRILGIVTGVLTTALLTSRL